MRVLTRNCGDLLLPERVSPMQLCGIKLGRNVEFIISISFPANVSKQMMQKLYLRKFRPHGSCQPRMKPIKLGNTPKTRDDYIYTFKCGHFQLYQVKEIVDGLYRCSEFNTEDKTFRRHPNLNFGCVGIFVNHGFKTQSVTLTREEIAGKVLSIGALLLTASENVLCER